jgi:peptidoglycan hydrolase-like protein with peptidoglycan-binding domain
MTAEAFSSIPFSAGGAVAATAGRLALAAFGWYMQAPLRNTAVAALVTLTAMAGSNALYRQAHHHPSPLFGNFETSAQSQGADPVMPAIRPTKLEATPAPVEVDAVEKPAPASKTVGNDDVLQVQRKLQALGLLDGKVDGLFGQRTSRAIKAFETSMGRAAKGELTPEIVALIKAAPIPDAPTPVEPVAAIVAPPPSRMNAPAIVAPAETAVTVVPPANAASMESKTLPIPAPLVAASASEMQPDTAIDPQTDTQTTAAVQAPTVDEPAAPAPASVSKRSVQTIAVRAAAPASAEASQAMPDPLVTTPSASASVDTATVAAVQRGLASLGFLHGEADGVAGEATAKAIRNFEMYFNYAVTGRISADLLKVLVLNGAVI